ncbi:substrate-binding periplasmic protein [Spirochaeta isovalerica]|uniref:ABC-type amino acid transport substrate-binding protein n=1 Tax=Spirochaeta isovalerica TaxID=150 RepID=A0A841RI24_9SPIO|nr:transporter substrate-binding domain-containing protein [Spirochaeta isovalerica]MBB6482409.1 ABC-type amino acid transport substrate-binding protein [Spirochaeta isovalerica]
MIKKIAFAIPFVFFLLSCGSEKTELEIDQDLNNEASESAQSQVSEAEDVVSSPLISVSPDDEVLIFVRQDGAPGMYLGDDGEVHGFYVDLEKMVMDEMGQKYKFIPYGDAGPVILGLKSGTHHIALAAPDLPGFRSSFNLSMPYEILHFVTFVQSDNNDIKGSTREELIASLHGKRVGVQTQGHIWESLRNEREIELIEYPTTTKAMEDLDKGLLDAVPDVKRIGLYYAAKEGWDIKPVGEPIISHTITTAISQRFDNTLIDRYNAALQAIIDDGRRDALYQSYFGPMGEDVKP